MFEKIFSQEIDNLIKSVSDDEYTNFLRDSVTYAQSICDSSNKKYKLGEWENWNLSQDTGKLTLSTDFQVGFVEAEIQVVGSFSYDSETWKWAWSNSSIQKQLVEDSNKVREFGISKGFIDLTQESWKGDENDGWLMSAILLKICGAEGLYSGDFGAGRIFFTLKNINCYAI